LDYFFFRNFCQKISEIQRWIAAITGGSIAFSNKRKRNNFKPNLKLKEMIKNTFCISPLIAYLGRPNVKVHLPRKFYEYQQQSKKIITTIKTIAAISTIKTIKAISAIIAIATITTIIPKLN
jgi:hypothetical protein